MQIEQSVKWFDLKQVFLPIINAFDFLQMQLYHTACKNQL